MIANPTVEQNADLPAFHPALIVARVSLSSPLTMVSSPLLTNLRGPAPVPNALLPLIHGRQMRKATFMGHPVAQPAEFAGVSTAISPISASSDPLSGVYLLELEGDDIVEKTIAELNESGEFASVSRVPTRYLVSPQFQRASGAGESPVLDRSWHLKKICWEDSRNDSRFANAAAIKVAILDSGVDQDHPDLAGRIAEYVYAYDDPRAPQAPADVIGHGTHVAGIIGADSTRAESTPGVSASQLYVWKICNDRPMRFAGRGVYLVNPIAYMLALGGCLIMGVDVVNLSIAGSQPPEPVESQLFSALHAAGSVVVAAMGNSASYLKTFPAAHERTIAVGATDQNDAVTSFSNRGKHVALCAPGSDIWATHPTYPGHYAEVESHKGYWEEQARPTDFACLSGTSMACAVVTGAVAALLANGGPQNPERVLERLRETADPIDRLNRHLDDTSYGAGRLNLNRLLWEEKD